MKSGDIYIDIINKYDHNSHMCQVLLEPYEGKDWRVNVGVYKNNIVYLMSMNVPLLFDPTQDRYLCIGNIDDYEKKEKIINLDEVGDFK